MYKVIIVDDEVYELESFAAAVDWNEFNIDTPEKFDNPEEALGYIYENEVDMVITDIRMPEMSGIDLIRKIHEYNPAIVTIIISAFADFEYAQAAIGLNVFGYILKPIKFSEFEEILKNAVEHLSKLEKHNFSSDMLYCRQVINDFLCGTNTDLKLAEEAIAAEGYNFGSSVGNVALMRLSIIEFQKFLVEVWHHEADRLYRFVCSQFAEFADEFFTIMMTSFLGTVDFVVISKYDDIKRFNEELSRIVESFSETLKKNTGIESEISVLNTYQNLRSAAKTASNFINLYKRSVPEKEENLMIDRAVEFINENYMYDISLEDVSRQINYAPYYFSKFFKRETGENFTNYLNRIRLERAKDLLDNTNERAVNIAQMVGYNSKNHFYKMFRLYYGCTPIEYRRRL